jgi:hypothetical protein
MPTMPSRGSYGSAEPGAGDSAIAAVSKFFLHPSSFRQLLLKNFLQGRTAYAYHLRGKASEAVRKSSALKKNQG